jgi:hypothetical protein
MPTPAALRRSITALAPTSVRERNTRSGTSGAQWRDSTSAKPASSTPEPATSRIVCRLPQPTSGASTSAETSRTSAPVLVSAPAGS